VAKLNGKGWVAKLETDGWLLASGAGLSAKLERDGWQS
jgi:hypothetical protein